MKQGDVDGFELFEVIGFSHGQLCFVIEAFDNA